jgi:hypothetical protein
MSRYSIFSFLRLNSKFSIRHSIFDILFLSVFFVSLSSLAFEVLLTRVFSIAQWNHLSFMVISIALFGFGASGSFLSIIDIRKKLWLQRLGTQSGFCILLWLYSFGGISSFLALNHLPLDYFRLAVEPIQSLYLLTAYLLLSLPFFFAGTIISIAYITVPEKTGLIYFATMAGSALGAVLPVPLLTLAGEGKAMIVSALLALIPIGLLPLSSFFKVAAQSKTQLFTQIPLGVAILLLVFFAGFTLTPTGETLIRVKPSPYKALAQILQFPDTQIVATTNSIRGRIDQVKTSHIHFAPGLSLKYTEALPEQSAFFKDGDNQFVLYNVSPNPEKARFAAYMLSYSGYYLRPNPNHVLLIQNGGGSAIPCAVAAGGRHISIIEPSPQIAAILRRQYNHQVINQNPRAFLAGSNNRYDIIQLENWGTSIPGTAALYQEHLLTIEALAAYWNHLTPKGVLIISRKLLLPPSDSLRLWSTAYEALKKAGINHPADHLAILRNFDTFTLLVTKPAADTQAVTEFARNKNFDLVFLAGMDRGLANRFNVFDEPYHFEAVNRLAAAYRTNRQDDFFNDYLLDVAPQSDRRPFPARFLKWSQVKSLYRSLGNRFYPLFMSGEIVIAVVFIEALVVALALLVLPILLSTREANKPNLAGVAYFLAVGAGFMFAEIFFIQRFIILVGDPVISFTLVVAGILFFTSIGGIWVHKKPGHSLRLPLAALITVLVMEAATFELLEADILKASTGLRYALALFLLLPAGFLMGLPFPLGMRFILQSPVQRAYAWTANGCASVLSSIVAAQIAISWGIPQVAAMAVAAYLVALVAVAQQRKAES